MMSSSIYFRILRLLVWLVVVQVCGSNDRVDGLVGGSVNQVTTIVSQVVEHHLSGCHLVLATTTDNTTVFSSILRRMASHGQASVVVDAGWLFSQDPPAQEYLLQGLWGDAKLDCRALILYMGTNTDNLSSRFLDSSGLWLWPEAPTVVIGETAAVRSIVYHASLRNAIHVLGLALDNLTYLKSPLNIWPKKGNYGKVGSERVKAYRRCLYCNKGNVGVQLLQNLNLSSPVQWDTLFPEKIQDLLGHTLKIVTLVYYPFIDFVYIDGYLGPLTPADSLDIRITNAMAAHLNFTYEMWQPWDESWGVPLEGGNWSGIVGTLQHEKADFSLNLTPSPERMQVITHSRLYTHDPLIIVSLKPGPLPRHLALTRPFPGEMWILVIVCTAAAGLILWLLQKAWTGITGQRSFRLSSALFYSWGLLLEDPPTDPPSNLSSQVFVGWWLLACLVIATAYRSSLIAHLSVQGMFLPINSFEDLVIRDGWSWGGPHLWGTTLLFFSQSSDPVIQKVYNMMEHYTGEEGMKRVMEGGFSFINHKLYTKISIESQFFDRLGYTPLHLSTSEYPILGGNAWGFRKGAPFLRKMSMMKQRLIEAGLLDIWLDEVIKSTAKRLQTAREVVTTLKFTEVYGGQMVLGLDHLQGVFYLLLLGDLVALLTFLGENLF